MRLSALLIVGLLAGLPSWGQSPKIIDISTTAPVTFPQDGAFVIGDSQHRPHAFWTSQTQLLAYQIHENGEFSALSFPWLPSTLSEMKMASRSYWANGLFFWGSENSEKTLWLLRDTGTGFGLTKLQTLASTPAEPFPRFWVQAAGRNGWLVFFQRAGGIDALFCGYDGSTRSLGQIYHTADPAPELRFWERPDLDSGGAIVLVASETSTGGRIDAVFLTNTGVSPVVNWMTLDHKPSSWDVVYNSQTSSLMLCAVSGTTFYRSALVSNQFSPQHSRDFGVPIALGVMRLSDAPEVLWISHRGTSDFWWRAADWPLDTFQTGVRPWEQGPLVLLHDASEKWVVLSSVTEDGVTGGELWSFASLDSQGTAVGTPSVVSIAPLGLFLTTDPSGRRLTLFHPSGPGFTQMRVVSSDGAIASLPDISPSPVALPPALAPSDTAWTPTSGVYQQGGGERILTWGIDGTILVKRQVNP